MPIMNKPLLAAELDRPPRRGDLLTLEIERLTHDAKGVARVGGKVVFVADALPGEQVDATIIRRRRSHDEARLEQIHRASPDRVVPRCRWFGNCGGCTMQHVDPERQLEYKQQWLLDSLQRIGGVQPQLLLTPLRAPVWGYRRRARLGVRYVVAKERVLVGFRERHKPYIADMDSCEVLHPAVARLLQPLQQMIGALTVARRLPQIEVAVGDDAVVLVLRVLDPPDTDDLQQLRSFEARHEVRFALQDGKPEDAVCLDGSRPLLQFRLREFDLQFDFRPTDFVQVNAAMNDAMISTVLRELQPRADDRILDLFCGLGNFTLPLARHAAWVTGVEGSPALVQRAQQNARRNGIGNADFVAADLSEDVLQQAFVRSDYQLVLLDPPRSGAAAVCEAMAALRPRRIAYVSCHPATLARDAGQLAASGYRLTQAGVMDMFPHTAHVESLAVFDREDQC